MAITIVALQAEHHENGFGIGHATPRLSWRFGKTTLKNWIQTSYEITIERDGKEEKYEVDGPDSILVPSPSTPLASRELARVKVTVTGSDGATATSPELIVEAGLLKRTDWKAQFISCEPQAVDEPKKPFRLTKKFTSNGTTGRIYATAFGVYQIEINGKVVGDHVLAPGWQSYKHHLNYQTYDISNLLKAGENTIQATVGEGWYAGRLGFGTRRNIFGDKIGFMGQVEVDGQVVLASDDTWDVSASPIVNSEIYNGETYDTTFTDSSTRGKAQILPFADAQLISTDAPPVRRIKAVKPIEVITTPSGKTVIDFGQNLVGWPRIERDIQGTGDLVIRHAEVLEDGELGTRPLRGAKATTTVKLGGQTAGWEPTFTFFGFR
jgi:alpha-L-rhamnosidase